MNGGKAQSGEGHSPSQIVRKGLIACTLGYAFVAIAPVIVASSEVHGTAIAFWRSWIDFSLIGLVCIFRKKMTKEMFAKCAPAGICFGASIGLYFWAAQMTSIINASLIVVLQPILFVVAAYFIFSEAFTKTDAAFTVIAITGAVFLVLVGTNTGTSDIKGDLLVVVSVSIGAAYFVFGRKTLPTVPVPEFMAGVFFWGGITLSTMISIGTVNPLTSIGSEWIRIFSVAVVTLLGHLLLNYAQGKAPFHMMGS
jgi:drug/metabolite transporter (DMT)-like permease